LNTFLQHVVSELFGSLFALHWEKVRMPNVDRKRFNFPETVPLVQLENGAVRVRNSRVTLETIVIRKQVGDTVERIHSGFPTVSVSQIKEILAWYEDNKAEADEYLQQVEAEGERLRQWIESQPGYKKVTREELLRRKALLTKI
jgi:uncharacterized protein (DUF433 family)